MTPRLRPTDVRQAVERSGRIAETVAAMLLRLKGYRIMARRFKGQRGEVDLIAQRRGIIAFIEVKRRPTHDEAAEAVSQRQRNRIVAAAEEFMARHPRLAGFGIRFDAVLVMPGKFPRHLEDAWRP